MADCKVKSLPGQMQLLLETKPDSLEKLKQRLVLESGKLENPFKFIFALISKGVLSDGTTYSLSGASFGLKETMANLALIIACSQGADAIGSLMESLEESENTFLISALQSWMKEEFGIDTFGGPSEPKEVHSAAQTLTSDLSVCTAQNPIELTSVGVEFIDRIMSYKERDFMGQLESHLVAQATKIVNAEEFCASLAHQDVLGKSDIQLKTSLELQEEQWPSRAIKAACYKSKIGSLVTAFQSSGNELILRETLEWLKTAELTRNDCPSNRYEEEKSTVKSTFFEQPAPLDELEKIAVYECNPEATTKGVLELEFDKDRMIAHLADGTIYQRHWTEVQSNLLESYANIENITCIKHDHDICLVGTAEGAVHLYDAVNFHQKWTNVLGERVHSLAFVDSSVVVVTVGAEFSQFWWIEISRPAMQLLNKRVAMRVKSTNHIGVYVTTECTFLYFFDTVLVYETKSGRRLNDIKGFACCLESPADISTLIVTDIMPKGKIVLAGCTTGVIPMWDFCKIKNKGSPVKLFKWHKEAVLNLCAFNGHLLSLDNTGELLMWFESDLKNDKKTMPPVPQLLADNLDAVRRLDSHERWFASSSSKHNMVTIWAVSDSLFRTG